jgi:hypothetical protein
METSASSLGVDLKSMVGQVKTQMDESFGMQLEMQKMASDHNAKSTMAKMTFDTEQAAMARISAVGEAVSRLTDQQSQQLSQ